LKGFLTILLALSGSACYAQQQKASFGLGTNGAGFSYEKSFHQQFSAGSSINYLLIKGSTVNYLLDNFIKTDYKTSSLQVEGFIKWFPQLNKGKSSTANQNRLYAKAALALRLNPSYVANSTFMDKPMVGSFELNRDQVGYVNIDIRTKRIQPMLAAGYSIVDKKKFFINTEAGVYFHGSPNVIMEATGTLHLNTVNQQAIQDKIYKYKYYPVLRIEAGIKL
jgi:hypothetical protein